MPTITVLRRNDRFPVGTSVQIHPAAAQKDNAAPMTTANRIGHRCGGRLADHHVGKPRRAHAVLRLRARQRRAPLPEGHCAVVGRARRLGRLQPGVSHEANERRSACGLTPSGSGSHRPCSAMRSFARSTARSSTRRRTLFRLSAAPVEVPNTRSVASLRRVAIFHALIADRREAPAIAAALDHLHVRDRKAGSLRSSSNWAIESPCFLGSC